MQQVIFVKLGGSLITDKRTPNRYFTEAVSSIGAVLREARSALPIRRFLVGHGGGSFGHMAAEHYGTAYGARSTADWVGFAKVAEAMTHLNQLVMDDLSGAGLPVWRVSPSASAVSDAGMLVEMATEPLLMALQNGLVPVVHGDVAVDRRQGAAIISTEAVFFYLANRLGATNILLLGDVDGVWDASKTIIPQITPSSFSQVSSALGASAGTDVTGGMAGKVKHMLRLVEEHPQLTIRIMGGNPVQVAAVLAGSASFGTLITADLQADAPTPQAHDAQPM